MELKRQYIKKDLVVIGGGIAGICAAVSAARNGIRVALINDRPMLGGNSSSEVRVPPSGSVACNPYTMETGIIEEILLTDRASNPEPFYSGYVNTEYDRHLLEIVRAEKNLQLFLNTTVYKVNTRCSDYDFYKKKIESVNAISLLSNKEIVFEAKQFVDCSGDGVVAYLAGAEYHYGRESRDKYNENLAPIKEDNEVLGATIQFVAKRYSREQIYKAPKYAKKFNSYEEIGKDRYLGNFGSGVGDVAMGYWWLEFSEPFNQVYESESIKEELEKYIYGIWDFMKNNENSGYCEVTKNYALEYVGTVLGKRESRRFKGDIILTEEEVRNNKQFFDAVATAGWYIDLHNKGGVSNKTEPCERSFVDQNYKHYTHIAPYTIPLRSLYSKDIENLYVGGRCMSVSHIAHASIRVQNTLGNIGEAIGIAASYGVKNALYPSKLVKSPHIDIIKQEILKQDVRILGEKNNDENDISLKSKAFANKNLALNLSEYDIDKFESLLIKRGQIIPITNNYVKTISPYIKNKGEKSTIEASLYKIKNIWDHSSQEKIKSVSFDIEKDFEGFVDLDFNCNVEQNKLYRLEISANDDILWARSKKQQTGVHAQYYYKCDGGIEEKNMIYKTLHIEEVDIPAYEGWFSYGTNASYSLALKIEPQTYPYSAECVNNGVAWPDEMPNIFKLEFTEKDNYIDIVFDGEHEISLVSIAFDTNLNIQHCYLPPQWKQINTPSDYVIYAKVENDWIKVFEQKDNFLRKNIATFDKIKATAIRVEITKLNEPFYEDEKLTTDKTIGIYEIRIY